MADEPPQQRCYLFDAAWRYASDRRAGRQFADLLVRSKTICGNPDPLALEDFELLSDLQAEMEAELLSKLVSGELSATWLPPGRSSPEPIHSMWWSRARVDLWLSQAQVGETVITGIEVISPLRPGVAAPAASYSSGQRRRGYAESDVLLRAEWETLLAAGMAPYPAAQQLAPRARGGGSPESKAKRLYDRFTQS